MSVGTDFPDWSPHVAAAVQYQSVGIPIGSRANIFTLGSPQTIVSGGSFLAVNGAAVSNFTSFDLTINAHCPTQATVGSGLALKVQLSWFDNAALTNEVYREEWYVPAGLSGGGGIGSGPCHGLFLRVTVLNIIGNQSMILDAMTITGTARTPGYTSIRGTPADWSINGATTGNLDPNSDLGGWSGNLGFINGITPGTGLKAYPLPLFAGPIWIHWAVSVAALLNSPTIVDMSQATSGGLVAGTGQSGVLAVLSNSTSAGTDEILFLPRSPCALVINPAATSSVQFSAIAQQGY